MQLTTLSIEDEDYLVAAKLRARHGLKLADALHLACAVRHGCDALWTNDDRLAVTSGALAMKLVNLLA
jgi:uncharacterized protein